MDGYRALREGAAWLELPDRGWIRARGEDRARLLHAMTTNHIQQLAPGDGCYTFLLSAQGRIQADMHVLCSAEFFWLETEPETRQKVFQHLDKYIIADDVTLEDASGEYRAIGVEGPRAAETLEAAGLPAPGLRQMVELGTGTIVAGLSGTGAGGCRIFLPPEGKDGLVGKLESAGARAASAAEARIVRLENARPRYGEDILETTLPQETQLMHAIHFSKGCYLGQEIVERIRSRGHVNRLLVQLQIDSSEPPAPGTKVQADGKEVGEVTSSAFSPALEKAVALAYVRAEHAKAGTALVAGELLAKVSANVPN